MELPSALEVLEFLDGLDGLGLDFPFFSLFPSCLSFQTALPHVMRAFLSFCLPQFSFFSHCVNSRYEAINFLAQSRDFFFLSLFLFHLLFSSLSFQTALPRVLRQNCFLSFEFLSLF